MHAVNFMDALRFSLPLTAFVAALAFPATAQVNSFTDIRAGLPDLARPAVAWGDYDGDGDLDLVLTGEACGDRLTLI